MKKSYKIVFFCILSMFFYSYLVVTRSVANLSDIDFYREFDRFFEKNNFIFVKDFYPGDWDEVCVIYPYDKPNFSANKNSYNDQLDSNFHLSKNDYSFPILSKYGDGIWWIFFSDSHGKIISLYRMSGNMIPFSPSWKGLAVELNKYDDKYSIVDGGNSCLDRESAIFLRVIDGENNSRYVVFVSVNKR